MSHVIERYRNKCRVTSARKLIAVNAKIQRRAAPWTPRLYLEFWPVNFYAIFFSIKCEIGSRHKTLKIVQIQIISEF